LGETRNDPLPFSSAAARGSPAMMLGRSIVAYRKKAMRPPTRP